MKQKNHPKKKRVVKPSGVEHSIATMKLHMFDDSIAPWFKGKPLGIKK